MDVCFRAGGMRNWLNIRRDKNGQAITEFVFILPILFIIFFVIVQFSNIFDYCQKSQMSLWCGLRAATIPKQKSVGVSVLSPRHDTGQIIEWIKSDIFNRKDVVDINIDRGQRPVLLNTVKIKVDTYVPYLYEGVTWKELQEIFNGKTVVRDGKKYFLIKYKGEMYLFTTVAPPV